MASLFPGVGLAGYRSFGAVGQTIAPLDRVTVVIGPNNSGKSTVLGFFKHHASPVWVSLHGESSFQLAPEYVRRIAGEETDPFRIAWPLNPAVLDGQSDDVRGLVEHLLAIGNWPEFRCESNSLVLAEDYRSRLEEFQNGEFWRRLSEALVGASGDIRRDIDGVFHKVRTGWLAPPPQVQIIPAHRHITSDIPQGATPNQEWEPGGAGLITRLDDLVRAEGHELEKLRQFDQIIRRVKSVLELDQFSYRVTRSQTLSFEIDDERRPMDALGTGYEHVFLIVATTVIYPDAFLCIEEPEVHLHPRLQRRLAEYLIESTSNQMLISTHSATLIDSLHAKTFRLALPGVETIVSQPIDREVLAVFDDLGYRASDLLQANCVIWVEGPSDRIYLNAWIKAAAAEFYEDLVLEEGIDYQVMFYGGGLAAHLTLASGRPDDVLDQIQLHRLNQRTVVVADSDRRAESDELKERVKRLQRESEGDPLGTYG